MGKREVRVVVVPKSVTAALLVLTTVAMLALTWFLGEQAHLRETRSSRELVVRAFEAGSVDGFTSTSAIAPFVPVLANVLLFVPWGLLAFLLFDRPSRPRSATYGMTVAAGILFALAVSLLQVMFPARLVAPSDIVANAVGAAAGALLGNLRKDVRVRFES